MKLSDLGEIDFLKALEKSFAKGRGRVKKSIGDDSSVTVQSGEKNLLATTDTLNQGVHFTSTYTTPYLLGRKAVSVSLSDIAAMGGESLFLLVSLSLPKGLSARFLDELYKGISSLLKEHSVSLVGGNTSSARAGGLSITTTVLGEVVPSLVVLRSGASPGELLFVTGTLGDSAAGLRLLKCGARAAKARGGKRELIMSHLDPKPRVKAGKLLSSVATAMIDLSDGLLLDLTRLALSSKVSTQVEQALLPASKAFLRYAPKGDLRRLKLQLTGGEDYELLFTAKESDEKKVMRISKKLDLPITRIGRVTGKGSKVKVIDSNGKPLKINGPHGYEHF